MYLKRGRMIWWRDYSKKKYDTAREYLTGEKWFFRRILEKEYKRLTRKRYLLRYGNAVLWRVAYIKYD